AGKCSDHIGLAALRTGIEDLIQIVGVRVAPAGDTSRRTSILFFGLDDPLWGWSGGAPAFSAAPQSRPWSARRDGIAHSVCQEGRRYRFSMPRKGLRPPFLRAFDIGLGSGRLIFWIASSEHRSGLEFSWAAKPETDTFGHEPALVARTCSPAKLLGFLKFVGAPRCSDARRCHPCAWRNQGAPIPMA